MRKIITWLDKGHNKGLYELMTNQIYTAVLGSIIYMVFDWGYTMYFYKFYSSDAVIRLIFLILGCAFYLSDFYYIKWSNPYRKWHFLFDLIFMICMLFSIKVLNTEIKNDTFQQLSTENISVIRNSYFVFLLLYLGWDIRELIAIYSEKVSRSFYIEVIVWEVLSLLLLLLIKFKYPESQIALLIVLTISTIWFSLIAIRKANHRQKIEE